MTFPSAICVLPTARTDLFVNAPCNTLTRKPDAGNPHVRFEEGEDSLPDPLYSTAKTVLGFFLASWRLGVRFRFLASWPRATVERNLCFQDHVTAFLVNNTVIPITAQRFDQIAAFDITRQLHA